MLGDESERYAGSGLSDRRFPAKTAEKTEKGSRLRFPFSLRLDTQLFLAGKGGWSFQ
jgi:hypothetical protein